MRVLLNNLPPCTKGLYQNLPAAHETADYSIECICADCFALIFILYFLMKNLGFVHLKLYLIFLLFPEF